MNIKLPLLALSFLAICGCAKQHPIESFNVSDVELLSGQFLDAQQTDINYLLALDADRLLAPYMRESGLQPVKPSYGNWENTGLDGHIGGHYLSALSYMYAASGNEEIGQRLNYFIDMLDSCQRTSGDGYLGGIPDGRKMWNEIKSGNINAGSFSLNNRWVPLYNIHKIFAGLRDAATVTDNQKARQMLINLTDWWIETTKDLTDEQVQQMLVSEHGGLNEVFADVYAITGNRQYLELARRFSHQTILEPLEKGENKLTGMHANTQIPKVIGFKRIADLDNLPQWDSAAIYFWQLITGKWSISVGGNSVCEHFHPTDNFSSMISSEQGPETCNSYNMLRLTKLLFLSNPRAEYADYYERTLFNHILSTQRPEGGFVYFTPMRPQHYRVYSQPDECFWCCVGSGLENHARYGEMIYAHTDNKLYVNLFMASKLNWKQKNVEIEQNTRFPYQDFTTLTVKTNEPKKFELTIRKPSWIDGNSLTISINGENTQYAAENGYVSINRKWNNNDVVRVNLPMHCSVEYLPDNSNWASVLYGPIVMAANNGTADLTGLVADGSRMGHVANGPFRALSECPVIISENRDFSNLITTSEPDSLKFSISMTASGKKQNIEIQPFNTLHNCRYTVYWPVLNVQQYKHQQDSLRQSELYRLELQKITVDAVQPGEQQPETEHAFKGEKSWVGYENEMHFRASNQWFGYTMRNRNNAANRLLISYKADNNCKFKIIINGQPITTIEPTNEQKGILNTEYKLPSGIGQNIDLRFEATDDKPTAKIFFVRLLK